MASATEESIRTNSIRPIAAQAIREAGGWAAAIAGAKLGGLAAGAAGIETGPGALPFAFVGAVAGGVAGYYGFGLVTDQIHKE
jgi:outer membrane lipoprotein SlyB